jgi:transposase
MTRLIGTMYLSKWDECNKKEKEANVSMQPVGSIALGLDISKAKFDARIEVNGRAKKKQFANTAEGYGRLIEWLKHVGAERVHACMEATGTYGEALAEYLHALGHSVSVVNPARIKGHAQSQMKRHKTDELDAEVIRHFCQTQNPELWEPQTPEIKALRALVRRLDDLHHARAQEANRQQSGVTEPIVRESIQAMIAHIDQQITDIEQRIDDHLKAHPDLNHQAELIESIPGIGHRTAIKLLAEFKDIVRYDDARSLAASVGVTPSHHESGTSVNAKTHISKVGNSALRGALWWPTISAMQYNPIIAAFAKKLRSTKMHNFAVIIAAMHKLIRLVYGVVKNNSPFDPNWRPAGA